MSSKNPEVRFSDSKKLISGSQYKITYISSIETEAKFERIKAIRSHVNPYATRDELLNQIFELVLEKIDPVRKAERAQTRRASKKNERSLPAPEVPAFVEEVVSEVGEVQLVMNFEGRMRYVPAQERHQVVIQNDGCAYVDSKTGESCGSKHFEQFDHVQSYSAGGANTAANGQTLCGAHNRFKWRESRARHAPRVRAVHNVYLA